MNRRAAKILNDLDIEVDVTQPLGSYSVAIQQMAAIGRVARHLVRADCSSSTSPRRASMPTRPSSSSGSCASCADVGHRDRLHHPLPRPGLRVADRITVLRNGRLRRHLSPRRPLPRFDLIAKMLGRNLTELDDMSKLKLATSEHGDRRGAPRGEPGRSHGLDRAVRPGAALPARSSDSPACSGSGRTEMAGLLFGVDKPDSGSITVDGKLVEHHSPLGSIDRGVALCPEDRKARGHRRRPDRAREHHPGLQAGRGWRSLQPVRAVRASPTSTSVCFGSRRRQPTSRCGP